MTVVFDALHCLVRVIATSLMALIALAVLGFGILVGVMALIISLIMAVPVTALGLLSHIKPKGTRHADRSDRPGVVDRSAP